MSHDFFSFLTESINKKKSLLCVGLDPQGIEPGEGNSVETILTINKRLIDQTYPYAACYKPNIAFYEAFGHNGLIALEKTINYIPDDTPVILDTKRSDIGNTAKAYADAIFDTLHVHATTLNPYLGKESVLPFLEYKGKGLFILCRTSNPGSFAIQELEVKGIKTVPLFLRIAHEACSWSPRIGLVVAGNDPVSLKAVRKELPTTWILAPGIGAQGGNAEEAVFAGLREDGYGLIISVSRSIAAAGSPTEKAKFFRDMIFHAKEKKMNFTVAVSMTKNQTPDKEKIDTVSGEITPSGTQKKMLIKDIIDQGCFRTGSFTLKSGITSPFYIDLRLLISNPHLLARAAAAYCTIIRELQFERIGGIPFAGIPIATCIAQQLSCPMIFPRLKKKEHGSGNVIEGEYNKAETIVLIDDLITTGKSKFEALDILKAAGLVVKDLVVLIQRGSEGGRELARRGVRLHACFSISDFIFVCMETHTLSEEEKKEIERFLQTT